MPASRSTAWPLKLLLGCTVALGLFGLLLGGLELGLRLCGYGHSPHFARTEKAADGTVWLRENRWVTAPFFAPEIIRRPQPFRIPAAKAPGTYRVFVLGSSAAMGDPEASFSLARVLDVLLREAHPEIRFEIVNAGITAINSTVVRGIAADCAALQPDLFIVYEGNNEVIGPFGPGTVFAPFLGSPAAVRASVAVRRSRTGQLLAATARSFGRDRAAPADWGGMGMFLRHGIAAGDPRLAATRELFRENLAAIADSGRSAGATVFLCTVATNRREFAPFLSLHRPALDAAALARWQSAFDAGLAALGAGNPRAAVEQFRVAAAIDDRHAETAYLLGRALLETGDAENGRANLQRALDLDALRFRTDSQLNAVVRSFAATPGDGLRVIDLARAADSASPGGVTGDELLYEHVHLNIRGTYLLARELCGPIEEDLRRRGLVRAETPAPTWAELPLVRDRLAYTVYEQGLIVRELLARFAKPPFSAQRDNDARLSRYRTMDRTVSLLLQQPETRADLARRYAAARAARPDDWVLGRNAGMALVATGQPAEGLPLLEQAVAAIPDDPDTLFALAQAHRALSEASKADAVFARLRSLEPRYPGLPVEQGATAGKTD
jgi:tetratricopeptide (TPR) repeat protein